jgi:hypothetical protein
VVNRVNSKNIRVASMSFVSTALIIIWGCGMPDLPTAQSLISRQPMVVAVSPEDKALISGGASIKLEFSQRLNPLTVTTSTLAIVELTDGSDEVEVVGDLIDGDITGVDGQYSMDEESMIVSFKAAIDYRPGAEYILIATNGILSEEMLPLNQNPGMSSAPFISRFVVGVVDADGNAQPATGTVDAEGNPVERNRPEFIAINELLYDVSGSDTDGDLFIELHGSAGGDITGYQIVFVNGPDGVIKDLISLPDGAIIPDDGLYLIADARTGMPDRTNVPGADLIDNFDPQNGPDCVQLISADGALVDSLGYGEPLVELAENGLPCFEGVPAMKTVSGQSLSRVEGLDNDNNFIDFTFLDIPSPGLLWRSDF